MNNCYCLLSMSFNFEDNTFREMADFFHENGYIKIDNSISPEIINDLKQDLYKAENNGAGQKRSGKASKKGSNDLVKHNMHKCFFENSPTTVDLIESSKLTDFAQYLIRDVPTEYAKGNSLQAHLIHNNAYSVPPDGRGQAPGWHVDDPLQQVIIPEGFNLPSFVKLPVLLVTYMIWLTDCETPENGPTFVVPGSHRSGTMIDKEQAEKDGIPMCGKAGTAVLVNCNLWHRGCKNSSKVPRETLQLTFGRRIIGHKFKTIMNYNMPPHVTKNRNEETREKLGFQQGGAYS
jgi:ectoine hydroxylase-related dioxygenase (phytanoyl-CoA dioxygenase family)